MKGTISRLTDKGYGFIEIEETDKDVFFHANQLGEKNEYNSLNEGDNVTFDVEQGDRGAKAVNVNVGVASEPEDSSPPETLPEEELVAFTLIGDKIHLVSLVTDGTYRFLDESRNSHNILYVASYETRALQIAVDELESLINDPKAKEKDFQDFFERFPEFILNDNFKTAHPHVVLEKCDGTRLIPDFVLEPTEQNALCELLEIKLPKSKVHVLKKNRARFSSAVLEASAQLREYSVFFDEQKSRDAIYDKYSLQFYKPKMFVIIGRRGNISPILARKIQSDLPNLNVQTYDDVVTRMKTRIDRMNKGRRV